MHNSDAGTPNKEPVQVRYALIDDLPNVLEMYMDALKEIKEYLLKPDLDKCANEVLTSWAQAPCVLLEKRGEIVGFAGLKTLVAPYTKDPQLSEYMFYIKPVHRSIKLARMLSKAVQDVAKRFKMPLFMAHMMQGHKAQDKEKFLRRWGYEPFAFAVSFRGDL